MGAREAVAILLKVACELEHFSQAAFLRFQNGAFR